ncbi:U4/U6 small nuclear ribonucleoprotein Prp31 homolog [Rutidosis leptorrhynchoides]|uniref:U4/U6 small nuclear ribonucleoprotein Prp31 homolog n=1 Tax=Rutidosis leptorrhynchoides TaxID=125765 RepID=UPI003A990865
MENMKDSFHLDNDNENLDGDTEHMEEDVMPDIETRVSELEKTQRYKDIMKKVEDALKKKGSDDPEYNQLIVECNALSVDIENEIVIIHNSIRDKYRLKFPELESLVDHPIDYARVVKKIGNEIEINPVDLEGLLPSAIIMVISVTASTTSGKPLPEDVFEKTIEGCDRALTLDESKKKVVDFFESRMGYIAPNLSAIVGNAVAAKLIVTAGGGGLSSLAKMPASSVRLLGAKKKNLAGFSTATSQFRVGYIEETEVFQTTPPALKMRACRLLAAKSTLAARVDSIRGDPSGSQGRRYREEIRNKIEMWQKQPKPLRVRDSEPKKKRGGRRLRKMMERHAITDMRKLANTMHFGIPQESSLGSFIGELDEKFDAGLDLSAHPLKPIITH